MNHIQPFLLSICLLACFSCRTIGLISPAEVHLNTDTLPTTITFGSCGDQDHDMPILYKVVEQTPDIFIYLGDNIYGDTRKMDVLKKKYNKLAVKPEFLHLRKNCTVLATWDDHDYGENDAGRHYPFKKESREIFLDFWGEPALSERRAHEGIYHSYMMEENGKKMQIILLDTRSFRDDLIHNDKQDPHKNDYMPNPSPDSTMLGDVQWRWLENQFEKEADLRIIGSSNQFGHEYNGWESWTNVPHERKKMIDLIESTQANGVMFISGDVHWGEISKLQTPNTYPIYDITASGITKTWPNTEPNENRVGEVIPENHFGLIQIDWTQSDPLLQFKIIGVEGTERVLHSISLSEISF